MVTIVVESFAVTIAGVWCRGKQHIQGIGPEHDEYIGESGECTGHAAALMADKVIGIGTALVFVLFQMYVLIPTYRRRSRACMLLEQLNEDGLSEESQLQRAELIRICPECLGSLLKTGDKRNFSEPYRRADGFFQKGRNAPNLPGANAPPSYGTTAWLELQNGAAGTSSEREPNKCQILPPSPTKEQHDIVSPTRFTNATAVEFPKADGALENSATPTPKP